MHLYRVFLLSIWNAKNTHPGTDAILRVPDNFHRTKVFEKIVPNDQVDIMLPGETRAAAENLKDFYVEFTTDAVRYVDSSKERGNGNVIVSPLSASMVLAMVANGVEGEVRNEIADYLGVSDISALNSLSNILLTELPKADNRTDLIIANSLWVDNLYKLTEDYSRIMTSDYLAEIKSENFTGSPAKVLKMINNWCSDKTDGLIKEMLPELNPLTLAVILNAVNFKGEWADQAFLREDTQVKAFHGESGDSEVEMMYSRPKYRKYSSDDLFEAFYLDFGNSAFSLMVVLPKEGVSSTKANELLTTEEFSKLENEASIKEVYIHFPKFRMDSKLELGDILAMGRFSGITNDLTFNMFEPSVEGKVIYRQGSSLEIDESGAKLVASTSGEIVYGSPASPTIGVTVDRPFYFFLKEKSTGACILSGRITDL